MFLLYSSIANYLITIFPLFITVSGFFDFENKRLNFYVILYGCAKIVGGYVKYKNTKLTIHVSDNKAIIFDLKNFKPSGTLKYIKGIELIEFNSLVTLKDEPKNYLVGAFVSNLQNSIFLKQKIIKDFLKVNNNLILSEKANNTFLFNFTFVLNLLVVFNIIVKILWSKL